MRHITEIYKDWQPTYAAYNNWSVDSSGQSEHRQLQAIIEMVGEAGEVLQVATKARRKGKNIDREKIKDELGDTLWGVVGVMNEFDISWYELLSFNMEKLKARNNGG